MRVDVEFKDSNHLISIDAASVVIEDAEIKGKVVKVARFIGPHVDSVRSVPLDCIDHISSEPLPSGQPLPSLAAGLHLKWWQVEVIREQVEAAREGSAFGRSGKIVTNSECTVEWDSAGVRIEIPEVEPDEGGD